MVTAMLFLTWIEKKEGHAPTGRHPESIGPEPPAPGGLESLLWVPRPAILSLCVVLNGEKESLLMDFNVRSSLLAFRLHWVR